MKITTRQRKFLRSISCLRKEKSSHEAKEKAENLWKVVLHIHSLICDVIYTYRLVVGRGWNHKKPYLKDVENTLEMLLNVNLQLGRQRT